MVFDNLSANFSGKVGIQQLPIFILLKTCLIAGNNDSIGILPLIDSS